MDQDLRGLFESALEDEPVPPPGDLAREAMAEGSRLRRRRGLLAAAGTAAGVVLILVATLHLAGPAPQRGTPMAAAETPAPVGDVCTMPVNGESVVASVHLREDITDRQRADVQAALRADPLVRVVTIENPDQAITKFRLLWQDAPGSSSFGPSPMAGAFLAQLVDPSQYPAFAVRFRGAPGVERVVRSLCPQATPSREHE
jgi:cell division transport system permease protein